jgi:hypothetical protein
MKRALLILAVMLLLPGVAAAQSTVGIFFDGPGVMHYIPETGEWFDAYLYIHNANNYVTGIEYQILTPLDPTHALIRLGTVEYPDNSTLQMGDPFSGHTITYWPPLNGFIPGYNLLATITFYAAHGCDDGLNADFPLVVGPHPVTGVLRATFYPDNEYFYPAGLTSIMCPEGTAVEEESWGAIKSLYR